MNTLTTRKLDNSHVKREKLLIRFRIIFEKGGALSYPLYIAANQPLILKIIKSCKEALKQGSNYTHLLYVETMNMFNSSFEENELIESIIKYICCYYPLENVVSKNLEEYVHISAHIHEHNEDSDIELVTAFNQDCSQSTTLGYSATKGARCR